MSPKIHQSFWSDPELENQPPDIKLAMLWIITNSQTNLCGFFEMSPRRFAFETGLSGDVLTKTIEALPRALKPFHDKNILYVRNFIRLQLGSGDQLLKNNIFKSVLTVFKGIRFEPLRDAILEDYPEIGVAAKVFVTPNERSHVVAPGLRKQILERDEFTCLFKGEILPEEELEVDHIIPRASGGQTVPENLVAVSRDLNTLKNNLPLEKFCSQQGFDFSNIQKEISRRALKPFPQSRKGKEKEQEKEKEKEILIYLNQKSGRSFRDTDTNMGFITARLLESGVDVDGCKKMIDRQTELWGNTPQAEYLRPETLFNKTKFDGYYAAKDLPIQKDLGCGPEQRIKKLRDQIATHVCNKSSLNNGNWGRMTKTQQDEATKEYQSLKSTLSALEK